MRFGSTMQMSIAPILRYRSSRQELASYMRSAVAPVYDFRKPIEKVRNRNYRSP
jgi:hypothetical protein